MASSVLTVSARDKEERKIGGITIETDTLTNEFLDSLDIRKELVINDYSMVGIQYGMGTSRPMWSPSMKQTSLFVPVNFGVLFTRYGKMFGYMPYFGFQIGAFYAQEGYKFEKEDDGYQPTLEGATSAIMEVIEVPFMAHCHFDFWKMKVMANIGLYGGYRLSIQRFGEDVTEGYRNEFLPSDRRWDYGIKGGLGFGFVFDPVELHFTAMYKHSFGTLYEPDYYSKYYYRYAYPTNFIFSVGLHFQLTRRTGKSKHTLKLEAKRAAGLIDEISTGTSGTGKVRTEVK